MTEKNPVIDEYLCKQLIRSVGAIISNSLHNLWLSRQDATDAMNACYETLAELLQENDPIEFKVINDQILMNSVKIEETSSNTAFLIKHLKDLEIQNFTVTSKATQEDFVKLLEIMEAHPEELEQLGGFISFLGRAKVQGITSRKVIIKEISEEEVVVDKKELNGKKGSGADVANIVAFLKGGSGAAAGGAVSEDVEKAASDPQQMASLIMQSAQVQQADNPLEGGESMVDFVVGCMRKTFTTLKGTRSGKTKTGRKRITKNLLLLEDEIIKRMREMSDDWSEDDLEDITQAVNEMTDEMKIDSLADDYMSQRKTIEKSEAKLLEFIKSKGIENVDDIAIKGKLIENGLGLDGWNQLVLKATEGNAGPGAGPGDGSGKGDGGEGQGGIQGLGLFGGTGGDGIGSGGGSGGAPGLGGLMDAISHLDILLDNMEKQFDSSTESAREEHADEIMKVFADVNQQINALVKEVEDSVESLIGAAGTGSQAAGAAEEEPGKAASPARTARNQVLTGVAAIIKNISEPLSMINTSLEMIGSKTFGSVNSNQSSIIDVAKKNADRIKDILDRLASLATEA